jgi:hypothetical protein
MKTAAFLPVLSVLALALPARSAEAKKAAAQPNADQQAMMAKWAAASTPGQGHRVLDPLAGHWTYTVQFWMTPGAPVETSTGTSESVWILGGRFLQQSAHGFSMGQPFEGVGTVGFNNTKGEYETVWIDNMATAMMRGTGRYDAAAKTLTETGQLTDCMAGKDKPFRTVTTFVDQDHHNYDMYMPGPDGKEFLCMKIVYTRKTS